MGSDLSDPEVEGLNVTFPLFLVDLASWVVLWHGHGTDIIIALVVVGRRI